MNGFFTADYVVGAFALGGIVCGIFGGFSGAVGFCAGIVSAALTVRYGHPYLAGFAKTSWVAWMATFVSALFAFGIVRMVVRKIVKGLLAQPADAIFGSLVACVTGIGLSLGCLWAARFYGGMEVESRIFAEVMKFVG